MHLLKPELLPKILVSAYLTETTSGTISSILDYIMNVDAAAPTLAITLLHLRQSMQPFFLVYITCKPLVQLF
jgi:hypothetical protein